MSAALDQADGGEVVYLDGVVRRLDQLFHDPTFSLQGDERQRGKGHRLSRPFQAFHHVCQVWLDEMLPFGADSLAEDNVIHGRFVCDLI